MPEPAATGARRRNHHRISAVWSEATEFWFRIHKGEATCAEPAATGARRRNHDKNFGRFGAKRQEN